MSRNFHAQNGSQEINAEGWKHVTRNGTELKCNLCQKPFTGTLTRVMDHLLGISGGAGGGVTTCDEVTPEFRAALEKDQSCSIVGKMKQAQKKQRIQEDVSRFTSVMPSTPNVSKVGGLKATGTLNSFWKPAEKQHVDDALADMFYSSAIPFNVARNPHFRNAVQRISEFGKGHTPPDSKAFRTTLLQWSKDRVIGQLAEIKASRKATGCTILSDGWSDKCPRNQTTVSLANDEGYVYKEIFSEFLFFEQKMQEKIQ